MHLFKMEGELYRWQLACCSDVTGLVPSLVPWVMPSLVVVWW